MENISVVIGRQLGSGGYEIAKKLSESLDFNFYDKELIELVAKKGDFHPDTVKKMDENAKGSFLYSIAMGNYTANTLGGPIYYDLPINDKLFLIQSEIIVEKAKEASSVFVGRCADYVLKNAKMNVLSVFIYASMDYKIKNLMEKENYKLAQNAKDKIIKTEKQRRSYYDYYTNLEWGVMKNYDLCLNPEVIGIDGCVEIIKEIVLKRVGK